MNTIPQYCQKCREKNVLGEPNCRRCGTRLMLVVFPQSLKFDTNYVPSYYEDHLLERVTTLELRLSQVTERLAMTLDLMLRQTKSSHSDHLLLETLIESLNTLGAIEKDKLTKNWRERLDVEELKDNAKDRRGKLIGRILAGHTLDQADLFAHLVSGGIKLLSEDEEKQGLRTLERALALSPENVPLLLFIGETLFRADKFESAKQYLEKAHQAAVHDRKAKLLLSVIYFDEGSADQAKLLVNLMEDNVETRFCTGYLQGMIGAFTDNWTEALSGFKETLSAKNSPETHYLIGCAYFQLGRMKMAVRHLRKAVEEDDAFSDAWYMLSIIYEILNEEDRAQAAVEQAWTSKETGAQCLEFLKRKKTESIHIALPFLRLKNLKNRFLTGGSSRLTRLFKEELFLALD